MKNILKIVSVIALAAIVLSALFVISRKPISKPSGQVGWKEEFTADVQKEESSLPGNWKVSNKPGTPTADFSIQQSPEEKISFLHMKADKASGAVITSIDGIDLEKTPILRWRWRASILPAGADGRDKRTDDQAIGIYIGSGSSLNSKSISYRWDTETPKGAEGNCAYGLGSVKVKWYTLRNKQDSEGGLWLTEERNVADDYRKAWGTCPEKIYLSISCNSQYTASTAEADLQWIEFVSLP